MARWISNGCGACMVLAAISCTVTRPPSLDEMAERYVQVALQLAQHQPALVEAWRGDASRQPQPRVPVAEIRARIRSLRQTLDAIPLASMPSDATSPARVAYLRGQLQALDLAAGRLLGEQQPFLDEVAAAFGVPVPKPDPAHVQASRETLARMLPAGGSLGERHAAFRRSIAVPRERQEQVLRAALAACRERVRMHLPLPADESIDLRLGVDSAWDGFARYQGGHRSVIEISGRSPLDVSRALHLACHEAYPGHHTQNVLLDDEARETEREELLLHPAFGPHLLVAEGAAEVGVDLVLPPAERVRVYRDVLLPAAGLPATSAETIVEVETSVFALEALLPDIVAAYLDSRQSREASLAALTSDAAVMDAESLLAFAERQRTRAVVYVVGRHAMRELLSAHPGKEWPALAALFSDGTFGAFWHR